MKRFLVLASASLTCLSFGLPTAAAATPPRTQVSVQPQTSAGGGDPWTNPSYAPTRGDWRPYLLAPASREVPAVSVVGAVNKQGSLDSPASSVGASSAGATLTYSGSDPTQSPRLTLDFGKEVAGNLALTVTSTSPNPPKLRAAFSESLLFMSADGSTGMYGDQANSTSSVLGLLGGADPYRLPNDYESHPLTVPPHPAGTPPSTVQDTAIRGGFRYVALFLESPGSVTFNSVRVEFTAAPKQPDLRDYKGWFLSSDNLFNKLWYSGAYTIQTDTIDPKQGGCVPPPPLTTDNPNCPNGEGDTILVDGAKRDRLPWGFTNFEESVAYTSTQDYTSPLNNIKTRLDLQRENGFIPGTSPGTLNTSSVLLGPFLELHAFTTRSAYDYILYSGDMTFATTYFARIQRAEAYTLTFMDSSGLINDTSFGCLHNIGYAECAHTTTINVLAYQSLIAAAGYADLVGQPAQAQTWRQNAADLASAMNAKLYDPVRGAFIQSTESSGVISQEGSAAAVHYGIAPPGNAQRILAYLKTANWNQYGSAIWDRPGGNMKSGADATLPWARYNDPYPSYYETIARIEQNNDQDAAELMRRYWGHMLDDDVRYPGSPPLTMWERESLDGLPTLVTNFPAELVSQSHDWGAGPTAALTSKVLGVTPVLPGFARFQVRPHPLDLEWVQGQVPTPSGPIHVAVDTGSQQLGLFTLDVTVPTATQADVSVPLLGAPRIITVDGEAREPNGQDGHYATYSGVGPGTHHFQYGGLSKRTATCPATFGTSWPRGTTATATSAARPRTLLPADVTAFDASNAVDGNPASAWEAADKNSASVTVQLPEAQSLGGLRLWFGTEGPPGQLRLSTRSGGVWEQVADQKANFRSLVDLPIDTGKMIDAVRLDLDGAHKDSLGAQRVRVFEVQPLADSRAPLALREPVAFTCNASGSAGVIPPTPVAASGNIPIPVAASGDIPIHFHFANSDLPRGADQPVRIMDRNQPATSLPPFGEHFTSSGTAGPGDSQHFPWASPTVSAMGLPAGVTIDQYSFGVWVLTSFPGAQPPGVATLHVNLFKLSPNGNRTLIAPGAASLPSSTLNQETLVAGTAPASVHLAPDDRLFADVYITGVRASEFYFSYDDRAFDSGISLHQVDDTAPAPVLREVPGTPGLLLLAGAVAFVIAWRRRRRGLPAR